MAKYSKGAGKKVEEVMHEMKEGKLKTGSGKKVTSRKQAIAIGLSEAREKGEKVPKKSGSKSSGGKTITKKATKKSSSKKSTKKTSSKTSSKSGTTKSAGRGSSKSSGISKRGLASATKATRKRVASKGGKSSKS